MRKMILFVSFACLLIAAGCSQASQASQNQSQSSDKNKTQMQKNKKDQQDPKTNESDIESFDWKSFSEKSTKNASDKPKAKEAMGSLVPSSIKIPAINVEADVVKESKQKDGKMEVPQKWENVGWYTLGAKPGEPGSAILAGHVDSQNGPAVFFNLKDLKKGDLVYINNKKGEQLTFKVFKKKAYPRNDAPIQKLFGYTPVKMIRMFTCTGNFDYKAHTHQKRLVVSAHLVEKDSQKKAS